MQEILCIYDKTDNFKFMERFTSFYVCIFILYIGVSSCNFSLSPGMTGNGQLISREIAIADYAEIELNGAANVIYEQKSAKAPYLQVYIDENLMPELDIKVDGERLVISPKSGKSLMPTQFKIYTNSRNLNHVQSNGTGDIHLKGEINAPRMSINIRGTGNVVSDSLYCEEIKVNMAGTGYACLAGAANEATLKLAGTGHIGAIEYFAQRLYAILSGTGDMEVRGSDYLEAVISGTGTIRYFGEPKEIERKISGTGRLEQW